MKYLSFILIAIAVCPVLYAETKTVSVNSDCSIETIGKTCVREDGHIGVCVSYPSKPGATGASVCALPRINPLPELGKMGVLLARPVVAAEINAALEKTGSAVRVNTKYFDISDAKANQVIHTKLEEKLTEYIGDKGQIKPEDIGSERIGDQSTREFVKVTAEDDVSASLVIDKNNSGEVLRIQFSHWAL